MHDFFRHVFKSGLNAASMVECLSTIESTGVKWILLVGASGWSDTLQKHTMDELRHSKVMAEQARRLRAALGEHELRGEQRATAQCLEATERYLGKLFGRVYRLMKKKADPMANALDFHVLLSLLVERRLMNIYPHLALHAPVPEAREAARRLMADEKEHLAHVTDELPHALAVVGLDFEGLIALENALAAEWTDELHGILNAAQGEVHA